MFKPKESDFEYIKKHYQSTSSRIIAEKLGCSASFVKKWGFKLTGKKLNKSLYRFNEDYFSEIDSFEKAYWLGFIMADGCIYDRNKGNCQKWLVISLQRRDEELLNKFKSAIESNHPIRRVSKNENRVYSSISLVSDKNCNELEKYGVTSRKSGLEKLPDNIDEKYIIAFIYGYFDADGSIVNPECVETSHNMKFSGNEFILKSILKYLSKLDIGNNIHFSKDKRAKAYSYGQISFQKRSDLIKLIRLFIDNDWFDINKIGLNRKYNFMKEYLCRLV